MALSLADAMQEAMRSKVDFEIHSHCMCLKTEAEDMPQFAGPGTIRISGNSTLDFTLYSTSNTFGELIPDGPAGTLIPDDSTYSLTAMDEYGHIWTARHVYSLRPHYSGASSVRIVGEIIEIRNEEQYCPHPSFKRGHASTSLKVFDSIQIPRNTATTISERVRGERFPRKRRTNLNVATFASGDYAFHFTVRDGELELNVDASSHSAALHNAIVESLQFVLARPIWWTMMIEQVDNTITHTIRARPAIAAVGTGCPPIDSVSFVDRTNCVWNLFAKYFEFVNRCPSLDWHHLSRFVYSVFEGRAASFDSYRLSLSIAVEGVIKSALGGIVKQDEQLAPAIESVKAHFGNWQYSADAEIERSIRNRLQGFLDNLARVRPVDCLHRLCQAEVITAREFTAWKNMRNADAHANRPGLPPTQAEIDAQAVVLTLMHKLIFQAIGYAGKYSDYGKRGYPLADFKSISAIM